MATHDLRPEILHAFGTPIVAMDIPNCDEINADLTDRIVQHRETNKGIARSNINSWHSGEDLVTWGGPCAQSLARTFASVCGGITDLATETGAHQRQWVIRMWANVFDPGALNGAHHHPGAFWSAVYYVSDGRDIAGEDVGGELVLHSPHESVSSMYAPDVFIRLPDGQRLLPTMSVKPRPGLGVIFPSWLMHEVTPYRGNRTRISIAMNFSLTSGQSRGTTQG